MSVALAHTDSHYSRDEYRRWCNSQPKGRFERIDGRIVAIAPESDAHLRMKAAIYSALDRAVRVAGINCQALPDGVTVETGNNDYQPPALVNCGAPMADDAIAAPNPVIIVEILPLGTTLIDTQEKLAGYFDLPSVHHYLLVHPIKQEVIHHRRVGDSLNTRIITDGTIVMDPPGITIGLAELYVTE